MTSMSCTGCPSSCSTQACCKPFSALRTQRAVSKAALLSLLSCRCLRIAFRRGASHARATASSSYDSWEVVTSSSSPAAHSSEAPTRVAILEPERVMRGVLLHRMSHAVVCALHAGVSRNRSARNPLFTCSSLGATSLKMIWDGETPRN